LTVIISEGQLIGTQQEVSPTTGGVGLFIEGRGGEEREFLSVIHTHIKKIILKFPPVIHASVKLFFKKFYYFSEKGQYLQIFVVI